IRVGLMCLRGTGTDTNATEAARWLRLAADRGQAVAQFHLGNLYESGLGVHKDATEAAAWYRKAAGQKEPAAEYALGQCYAEGKGVTQDLVAAYKWMALAAAHGHQPAVAAMETIANKLTPEQKALSKTNAN